MHAYGAYQRLFPPYQAISYAYCLVPYTYDQKQHFQICYGFSLLRETAVRHESHKPLTVPFLIPTTNHSNSSLQFQPHNSSNQLSSRRCSVTCTAVSIGSDCDDSFTAKLEISPEPVAAASLGKVYQARLRRTWQVVAVKVQRPGVQASV
ncbi:hypothetical protein KIW84_043808 [Lathyrus oleraceus]|uniref:ABC1 atypical kinase-like domain-containing protein n=1 Tax=Pisum sativum TaxID=3888 RepID=A0A9D5AV17_PEA|nr:hypothetical protein KIW84_043808 [Pisum sativum]